MKKYFCLLLFVSLTTGLYAQVVHDEMAQQRNSKQFHSVKVSGGLDVFISQGQTESVAVSAKTAEWRDLIRTAVVDGVLMVSVEDGGRILRKFGNRGLKVYIGVGEIRSIEASGACDIRVNGTIEAEKLSLSLFGASDFYGAVAADYFIAQLSGASDATIIGSAKNLEISASGASNFKGYQLQASTCKASASGASDIKISVTELLQPRASGASSIRYNGDAVIKDIQTSGASSVSKGS